MQKLSRDLERGCTQWPDVHVISIRATNWMSLFLLPFHAFVQALFLPLYSRVHLCDLSLGWLGLCISFFRKDLLLTATACGLDVLYPYRIYQWLLRKSLSRFRRIVCISSATADEVYERGARDDQVMIIPCGVWPENSEVKTHHKAFHLLSVGRLVPRKGIAWFVREVFPMILQKYPEARYSIIGEGKEKKLIQKIVQEKQLDRSVLLHGNLQDTLRDALYAQSDLFIMPNISVPGTMEGFGIVCIEASVHGLPVLASDIEGVRDAVLDGMTGKFFEAENPDSCMRALDTLLHESLTPGNVRANTIEHFSWNILLPRYRSDVFGF